MSQVLKMRLQGFLTGVARKKKIKIAYLGVFIPDDDILCTMGV